MDAKSIITSSDEPTKMTLIKMSSSTQENTNVDLDTTVYSINKEPNTINIRTDNINIQTTSVKSVNPFEQIVLEPPDINFKNLKGYQSKEKAYKLNLKKQAIIDHINNALSIYTDEEKKYNTDIVIFVCQCVEDCRLDCDSHLDRAVPLHRKCAPANQGRHPQFAEPKRDTWCLGVGFSRPPPHLAHR